MTDSPGTLRPIPDPQAEADRLAQARKRPAEPPGVHAGLPGRESNREMDIRIAVTHSRTQDELLGGCGPSPATRTLSSARSGGG